MSELWILHEAGICWCDFWIKHLLWLFKGFREENFAYIDFIWLRAHMKHPIRIIMIEAEILNGYTRDMNTDLLFRKLLFSKSSRS